MWIHTNTQTHTIHNNVLSIHKPPRSNTLSLLSSHWLTFSSGVSSCLRPDVTTRVRPAQRALSALKQPRYAHVDKVLLKKPSSCHWSSAHTDTLQERSQHSLGAGSKFSNKKEQKLWECWCGDHRLVASVCKLSGGLNETLLLIETMS